MEIERKFLVNDIPFELDGLSCHEIRQAYLSFDPEIRIRQLDDMCFLTKKGDGALAREEKELVISPDIYGILLNLKISNVIEKTRYIIPIDGGVSAELDVFSGLLKGLSLVEVEFQSISEASSFCPPLWFGRELTKDAEYKNKNLSTRDKPPFS